MNDKNNRKINYLRLSITENCNLKCKYCLPEKNISVKKDFLNIDEIEKIVSAMALNGIEKVRITGGEPLIRKDFLDILKRINNIPKINKIAVTTNGLNLLEQLENFYKNGLKRINISLDSLDKKKYKDITRGGDFNKIISTIKEACKFNFEKIRLNVVILKDVNDDEILDFVNLTKNLNISVRFIELMPLGEGKRFSPVKNSDILKKIKLNYNLIKNENEKTDGPAQYFKVKDYIGEIGFISPMSNRFCESCNRVRVTSDGFLKLCLHFDYGINLKPYLSNNTSVEELAKIIEDAIYNKPREHSMDCNSKDAHIETKKMNEIGG
ncbi:GTP 3',8-cyclase MoaA [uncultured Cetobacterium sp.]|uniref:GTP 3',8-cyclase MoaA n=1 Tax=uncultured Cetobacterium sp. TaxID=527638 RepID=UPI002630BC27|nr:GTP 3',8-cyclase MoaA [uncultured Cetobacterium sp.]